MTIPLSILDLSPVPAGGTAADALRNSVDLARVAERAGYRRYWVAEHHLASGVASSSTPVLVALIAAATSRIRVGSGAVQLPVTSPLQAAEQFGTVAALHPGRSTWASAGSTSTRSSGWPARLHSRTPSRRPCRPPGWWTGS